MPESPYKEVEVPLAGGLKTRTNPHTIQPGDFRELVNVRFSKDDLLDKRFGYNQLSTNVKGSTSGAGIAFTVESASGVMTREDELVLVGTYDAAGTNPGPSLFSWNTKGSYWSIHGKAAHPTPTTRGLLHAPNTIYSCDSIVVGGYVFTAIECDFDHSGTIHIWSLVTEEATGTPVQGPYKISNARSYAPCLTVNDQGQVALFWYEDNNKIRGAIAANGIFFSIVTIAVDAKKTAMTVVRPALHARGGAGNGTSNGRYFLAYWSTEAGAGNDFAIHAKLLSSSLAILREGNLIDPSATPPSIPFISVMNDEPNANYWVMYSWDDGITVKTSYTVFDDTGVLLNPAIGRVDIRTDTSGFPERLTRGTLFRKGSDGANVLALWGHDSVTDDDPNSTQVAAIIWSSTLSDVGGVTTPAINQYKASLSSDTFDYNGRIYYYGCVRDVGTRSHLQLFDSGVLSFINASGATSTASADPLSTHGIRVGGTAVGFLANNFASDPAYDNRVVNVSLLDGARYATICAIYTEVQSSGYSISLAIDNFRDEGRHKGVQYGDTLYFAPGGKYDGLRVNELSWLITPPQPVAVGSGGAGLTGDVGLVVVWKSTDINGNVSRSAPSPVKIVTLANKASIDVFVPSCNITQKNHVLAEIYITELNDIIFYLSGTIDTSVSKSVNNVSVTISATAQTSNPILYTQGQFGSSGGRLPNLGPGSITCIQKFKNRLFGIDDLGKIRHSNERVSGEEPFWHDLYQILVEDQPSSAIGPTESGLAAFSTVATWLIFGDGPAEDGSGATWSIQRVPTSVGCSEPNSVVQTGEGLVFMGDGAIYVLNRGMVVTYVGQGVNDFAARYPFSQGATHIPHSAEVRLELTDGAHGVAVVYDEQREAWMTYDRFDLKAAIGATYWMDAYVWCSPDGKVYLEDTSSHLDGGAYVKRMVVLPFIKDRNLQSKARATHVLPLGEWATDHELQVSFQYDYRGTWSDPVSFTNADMSAVRTGDVQYQFEVQLENQKSEAVSIRLVDIAPDIGVLGIGRGSTFSSVLFKMMQSDGGAGKLLPPEQRK